VNLATLRAGQDIRQAGLRKNDVRMLIIEQVEKELTDSPYAKFDSGDLILPQRGVAGQSLEILPGNRCSQQGYTKPALKISSAKPHFSA
jgi:hypothetical protein